jgi:hypothetical protein
MLLQRWKQVGVPNRDFRDFVMTVMNTAVQQEKRKFVQEISSYQLLNEDPIAENHSAG